MNNPIRFLVYILSLNLIRYAVGMPIEAALVTGPMFATMEAFPNCFNVAFGANDFIISLFYNFTMWFAAGLMFHLAHPSFTGPTIWRSVKIFLILLLFYLGLTAAYMNHYTDEVKTFYLYSMLDGLILFLLVGIANGLIYRFFFKVRTLRYEDEADPGLASSASGTLPPLGKASKPSNEPLSQTVSPPPKPLGKELKVETPKREKSSPSKRPDRTKDETD